MFHDDVKIDKKHTFSEKEIIRVKSGQELLTSISHSRVVKQIYDMVPTSRHSLYRRLNENFARFVQALPGSNFNHLGSILEEGLHRGLFVLQLQRQENPDSDPLEDFVLYSASLLYGVSKVVEEHTVFITNIQGEALKIWWPHEGYLPDLGQYYRIRRGGGYGAWLRPKLTPILAHTLLPKDGYAWLASNPRLLALWLALLTDDHRGAGGLDFILNRALKKLLKLLKAGKLTPIDVDKLEPEGSKASDEFIEWLKEAIKSGKIKVNEKDALVYMTEEGLFLEIAELIREFSRYNHAFSASQVYEQFKRSGLPPLSGDDFMYSQVVDTAAEFAEAKSNYNLTKESIFAGHGKTSATHQSFKQHLAAETQSSQAIIEKAAGRKTAATKTAARQEAGKLHQAHTLLTKEASTVIKNGILMGDGAWQLITDIKPEIAANLQLITTAPSASSVFSFITGRG